MTEYLVFALLGLANGAVFASLALALVVTYRSSGVVNFGTGAVGVFTAYVYAYARQGNVLGLIPGLPRKIHFGGDPGFFPAAIVSLIAAAVLGLFLYYAIFRPLRHAPAVAKSVASLGVMVVMSGYLLFRLGLSPIAVAPIFPAHYFSFGGARVSGDRFWFAVSVIAIAVVLGAIYKFTRFGLATRAASESEKGAYVSGISPDRIAALNWMIGAVVSGAAGILISPIVPLTPSAYILFIVPALAAAILGNFKYLSVAVIGGLAIGIFQAEAQNLAAKFNWLPSSGLSELVPLLLILAVLVVRAQPLPSRGAVIQQALGRAPRPNGILIPTVVSSAVGVVALLTLHNLWLSALVSSLIFSIISLSWVVVSGYAGQISLAQLTLAGVAGFFMGPLTSDWGVPFPIAPLLAALLAMVVGVIVGLPSLRIRGLPVAVVTLALAVAVQALWFTNSDIVSSSGIDIKGPTLFGLNLRAREGTEFPRLAFCLLVLAVLMAVAIGVAKLRTSRLGFAMLAVRANERSAAAAGINVVQVKVIAFAIGAFIAGLGGALLAYLQSNVTVDSFDVILGLGVFATVYLAGITSVAGGITAGVISAGGLVQYAAHEWIGLPGDVYNAIAGLGLVITVIVHPEGLTGPWHQLAAKVRHRLSASKHDVAAVAYDGRAVSAERAPVQAGPVVLSIRDVTVRFGGVVAVSDVSFDVHAGTIVGLIGPNGAGKTTLLDAISGFVPSHGSVVLGDNTIQGEKPHRRVRGGLGRTFQAIELWNDLTVLENIAVGLKSTFRGSAKQGEIDRVVNLLQLAPVGGRLAGELSQGQRQLVSIARALVGAPQVLLLDEPAGGLDSTEGQWLAERLRDIRDSGVTIVLIDHDMGLVLSLCDEIQVLNFGAILASGTPGEIRRNRDVAAAYLGDTHAELSHAGVAGGVA
jgi:ABC-type branched-subunit amino acid transport system ATPase component/ABC-type branched-subunit amino acid transport system permease subunit